MKHTPEDSAVLALWQLSVAFDALLAEAVSIADADKRREIAAKGEALIQEEGVTVQPYWRSLFRHMREGLVGTDMHITYEHHHYKWGWAA